MILALREILLLLLAAAALGDKDRSHQATDSSGIDISQTEGSVLQTIPVSTSKINASPNQTCGSATANYITHTLPQQCLRTDRASTFTPGHIDVSASNPTRTLSSSLGSSTVARQENLDSLNISSTPSGPSPDSDADSALDNANFLSFEEWKKQNLAKTGQSSEGSVKRPQPVDIKRPGPGINNALEGLGEESEIDIDFGFGGAPSRKGDAVPAPASGAVDQPSPASGTRRSKDAGKTCKERTNYASFDCAATVLKTNPECKSASSVLVEHKDSYMLNTCSADNKFFIVELCDEIQIDTLVLANYEFFSSVFRHFRVSVSNRYPVKIDKWKILGTFEARNTRDVQAFLVENPLIWAKYLRVEVLSYYGNEYYCPISLLRVHGTTMIQDYRHDEELARGEIPDDVTLETETETETSPPPLLSQSVDIQSPVAADPKSEEIEAPTMSQPFQTASTSPADDFVRLMCSLNMSRFADDMCPVSLGSIASDTLSAGVFDPAPTTLDHDGETKVDSVLSRDSLVTDSTPTRDVRPGPSASTTSLSPETNVGGLRNGSMIVSTGPEPVSSTLDSSASNIVAATSSLGRDSAGGSTASSDKTTTVSTTTSTSITQQAPPPSNQQQPQPPTQESFFKSVNKRLQQLESNSTLSLQYIEEQSRILRDAFGKVEKRQNTNTLTFLSHLNATVMTELRGFRQAYDQLWQSTVIELESHREQYQQEMLALSTRMTLVADELLWQKRMGIVQSTLLLLCLGLVLFAKQGGGHLEIPLAQHMMRKSQAALRAGWDSDPGSPSPTSRSPVSLLRRQLWRSRTDLGDMTDGTESRPQTREGLDVHVQPPTPPRDGIIYSDDEEEYEEAEDQLVRTQSEPLVANGALEWSKKPPDTSHL